MYVCVHVLFTISICMYVCMYYMCVYTICMYVCMYYLCVCVYILYVREVKGNLFTSDTGSSVVLSFDICTVINSFLCTLILCDCEQL